MMVDCNVFTPQTSGVVVVFSYANRTTLVEVSEKHF